MSNQVIAKNSKTYIFIIIFLSLFFAGLGFLSFQYKVTENFKFTNKNVQNIPKDEFISKDLTLIFSLIDGSQDPIQNSTILQDDQKNYYLINNGDLLKKFDSAPFKELNCDDKVPAFTIELKFKDQPNSINYGDQSFQTKYVITDINNVKLLGCAPKTTNVNQLNNDSNQIYTSPDFHDFKLVYNNSWKFETYSNSTEYENLKETNIILKQGSIALSFIIRPKPSLFIECKDSLYDIVEVKKLKNGMKKLSSKGLSNSEDLVLDYSTNDAVCFNNYSALISSNQSVSQVPKYQASFPDDKYVYYEVIINNDNLSNYTKINPKDAITTELDKVISESVFK